MQILKLLFYCCRTCSRYRKKYAIFINSKISKFGIWRIRVFDRAWANAMNENRLEENSTLYNFFKCWWTFGVYLCILRLPQCVCSCCLLNKVILRTIFTFIRISYYDRHGNWSGSYDGLISFAVYSNDYGTMTN